MGKFVLICIFCFILVFTSSSPCRKDQFCRVMIIFHPHPSSKNPHFQNEAMCKTFLVKMSFICMRMKNHFHIKG